MLIIVPALWVASIVIQFGIMIVVMIVAGLIHLSVWIFNKVKGKA